jgi:hypothetical protein
VVCPDSMALRALTATRSARDWFLRPPEHRLPAGVCEVADDGSAVELAVHQVQREVTQPRSPHQVVLKTKFCWRFLVVSGSVLPVQFDASFGCGVFIYRSPSPTRQRLPMIWAAVPQKAFNSRMPSPFRWPRSAVTTAIAMVQTFVAVARHPSVASGPSTPALRALRSPVARLG